MAIVADLNSKIEFINMRNFVGRLIMSCLYSERLIGEEVVMLLLCVCLTLGGPAL